MVQVAGNTILRPYVPRLVLDWHEGEPDLRWREIDSSMVFVDVSGFTKMSERLARQGRVGAEEITEIIGKTFGTLLAEAYTFGGSLLKFGGDALLLLFVGAEHPVRAAAAARAMRLELRRIGTFDTTAGKVTLRMSVGAHTGRFHFFLVGDSHRELIVAGPGSSELVAMEGAASAGQILMSPALADALPPLNRGRQIGPGVLLARTVEAQRSPVEIARPEIDLLPLIPVGLRNTLLAGGLEPEHRSVVVAFINYSHFDDLLVNVGPEHAALVLDELVSVVQRASDSRGVTFLSTDIAPDGGKIILTTGAPDVTGNDEEMMLLALRDIVSAEHPLPIEIGVNQGYVFAGEIGPPFRRTYTVMGDAVNLAARLMAKAEPNQILTTAEALAGSRTLFDTSVLQPFQVKGKAEPVQAFSVGEPTGSRAQISEAGLPLVGRDEELTVLLEAWQSAQAGAGRVVELEAEAGMGKSRLLEEFLAGCESTRVLSDHCRLYQSTTPYYPFRALLRRAFGLERLDEQETIAGLEALVLDKAPELEPWISLIGIPLGVVIPQSGEVTLLGDEFRRTRLGEAVEGLLSAVLVDPIVLTIEDTHWMDEASRDLLLRLASSTGERPWLIVLSRRPGADGFVVPEKADHITSITLAPLGIEHASELINAASEDDPLMPGQVESLAERAHGNPLFLIELLDALRRGEDVDSLPQSLEGLIQARIDRLVPGERTTLRRLAVLGAGFQAEYADAVLSGSELTDTRRTLRRLADFVSVSQAGWVQFRHALIRDAAYEGLPYRTRQRLHSQVGDSICAAAGDDPEDQAEQLSLHYFHAKRWPEAWTYGRTAGDAAKAIYANLEAATFYERALEAARRLPDLASPGRVAVLTALGDVWEQSGRFEGALDAYRKATRLVGADPVGRADLHLKRARARERQGAYSLALREVTTGHRAIEGVRSRGAAQAGARLSALGAAVRLAHQQFGKAVEQALAAVDEARESGELTALARAYGVLDLSYRWLGQGDKAVYASEALAIFEELNDLAGQAVVTGNMGVDAYFDGRWDEALRFYDRSRDAFVMMGNEVHAATAAANEGEVLINQGKLDQAEPLLREALRVLWASGFVDMASFAEVQVGRVLVERGDLPGARHMLEKARCQFTELGQAPDALEAAIHLASCWLRDGDPAEALRVLDEAESIAGGEDRVHAAPIARMRAQVLAELGRLDEAIEMVAGGLKEATGQGIPYEEALLLLAKAEIERRADTTPDVFETARANEILSGLGVQTPPRPPG